MLGAPTEKLMATGRSGTSSQLLSSRAGNACAIFYHLKATGRPVFWLHRLQESGKQDKQQQWPTKDEIDAVG